MFTPAARTAASALTLSLATAALAVTEQARPASSFTDSIGVNTHYVNSIYTNQNAYSFPAIDQKLADLGVRHIRDNTDAAEPYAYTRIDSLYSTYGIRSILVPNSTASGPAAMLNLVKSHPVYEAVEGLNEPDFGTPRTYNGLTDNPAAHDFSATLAYQNDLFAAIKGDPKTTNVQVLSAAMGSTLNMQYLNGANFDVASMHSYPVAHSPTFNLDTHITRTSAGATPPKPIYATETGYYNQPADGGQVSESSMGKYTPRLFAEYFNRNVARTYSYELVDENPTTDKESNFGLLHWDLTPKPAYTALKNLITILGGPADPNSPPPAAASTTYSLSSAPTTLHHTLLQRADGAFCLMLWNEVASWSLASAQDITSADLPVTLTLPAGVSIARTFLPGTSDLPTATYASPTSLNLSVPDQILVVEFTVLPEPALLAPVVLTFITVRRRTRPAA